MVTYNEPLFILMTCVSLFVQVWLSDYVSHYRWMRLVFKYLNYKKHQIQNQDKIQYKKQIKDNLMECSINDNQDGTSSMINGLFTNQLMVNSTNSIQLDSQNQNTFNFNNQQKNVSIMNMDQNQAMGGMQSSGRLQRTHAQVHQGMSMGQGMGQGMGMGMQQRMQQQMQSGMQSSIGQSVFPTNQMVGSQQLNSNRMMGSQKLNMQGMPSMHYQQNQNHLMQMSAMQNQNNNKINTQRRKKQNLVESKMIQSARIHPQYSVQNKLLDKDIIQQIKNQLQQQPQFWWINVKNYQNIFKFQEYTQQIFQPSQNPLQNYYFIQKTKFFFIKNGEIDIYQDLKKIKTHKTGEIVDLEILIKQKNRMVVNEITELIIYDKQAIANCTKQFSLMNFNYVQSIIQKVSIFNTTGQKILEDLAFEFQIVQYKEGNTIIKEKAINNSFFILIEGNVAFYKNDILYQMMEPYQFVGENVLNNYNEYFSCICESDSKFLQITKDQIIQNKIVQQELSQFSFYNLIEHIMSQSLTLQSIDFDTNFFKQIQHQQLKINQIVVQQNINDIVIVIEGQVNVQNKGIIKTGEIFFNYFDSQESGHPAYNKDKLISTQLICVSPICRIAIIPIFTYLNYQKDKDMLFQVDEQISGSSQENDLTNLNTQIITYKQIIAESSFSLVIEVEIKAKRYVCKCISKAIIEQFQLQSQLTNERELYDKLTDGFCPKVHCTFQNEDYIFIIMELLEGVNLDEYLEDQRPNLSAQNLQHFVCKVGKIIQQFHIRSIIHRDIKPNNFIINPQNLHLKIIDFGFGKIISESDKMYTRLGTPHYMSPEVICGNGYSYDGDCWAFGICIFEIIFGYLPWGEFMDDPYEINKSILKDPLQLPEMAHETIPQLLSELIQSILNKDLGNRLTNMNDIMKHSFFLCQPIIQQNLRQQVDIIDDLQDANSEEMLDMSINAGSMTLDEFLKFNQQEVRENTLANIPFWDGNY